MFALQLEARGLAFQQCVFLAQQFHFVGLSPQLGRQPVLVGQSPQPRAFGFKRLGYGDAGAQPRKLRLGFAQARIALGDAR
jgi:hypothetical protein